MKQLLYILFAVTLFTACSSDDDNDAQDYTSFTVANGSSNIDLTNVVAGYIVDGHYKLLTSFGDINKNSESKEFIIKNTGIKDIYFFSDYVGGIRINKAFQIKENTKNKFVLTGDIETIQITDKSDPTQYPQ